MQALLMRITMNKNCFILLSIGTLLSVACVPLTRFQTLEKQNADCQEERKNLITENDKLMAENREFKSSLDEAQQNLQKALKDNESTRADLEDLQLQLFRLNKDYDDLKEAQQALLKGSESEIRKLMSELQESQQNIAQQEMELNKLSVTLDEKKKNIDRMQEELNQRNARLTELENVLKEQEAAVIALKKSVSEALTGFENQGLTVTQKRESVCVA
jgi:chemotaxis protein MotB